jgi:peptidoglycan/xylan/chitin deacetylase (PgdA/CDA1 family)
MKFTFRDDFYQKKTDVRLATYVHNQFITHHKTHTVTMVCDGLEKNKDLINYMNKTHNWDICIHGWVYENYALMSKWRIEDELDKCILKIEELFGVVPEKWYLPWNGWTAKHGFDLVPKIADLAIYHGVDVDIDCDHIDHMTEVLESGRKPTTNTVYFHSWDVEDLKLLPNLLYLTRRYSEGRIPSSTNLQDSI